MMLATPTVRLVDDDNSLRSALIFALEMAGLHAVGYESAEAFLQRDDPKIPGCVVMDIRMEGISGLECQARMRRAGFDQPVIFLSGHGDIEMALQAVKQGAADFFTKPVPTEKLVDACRRLFDWNATARARRRIRDEARERIATLTPREREVAHEALTGAVNKTIAATLGISEQAVKIHRSNIYAKLGVHSVVEIQRVFESAEISPLHESEENASPEPSAVEARLLPPEGSI